MDVVVDDRLLLDLLVERSSWLGDDDLVYTTMCWYYRLARAASHGDGTGSLSRQLASLPPSARVLGGATIELPSFVRTIGPRLIVPVMAALRTRLPLNMLAAEGLAVAVITEATIVVATDAPLIRAGCADLGIEYRVV